VRIQFYSEYGHEPKFDGEHGYTRMSQLYAVEQDAGINGGSWADRRYYNRNDINSDYFYWNKAQRALDQVAWEI
jgi:maltoporin